MSQFRFTPVILLLAIVFGASIADAQVVDSKEWCKDSGTFCWNETKSGFAGFRFIGEPKLGYVFAKADEDNRVEGGEFANFTMIGGEINIYTRILSAQFLLITPGRVKFDSLSPLVTQNRLLSQTGEVGVDNGFAVGVSIIDGILAVGIGRLRFDRREIRNPADAETHSAFTYVNVQAISAIRAAIKLTKP